MRATQERSIITKRKLMDAALQIVAEEGARHVTHRSVSARAGLSLGLANYHYASLTNLLIDAFRHHVERVSERYEEKFSVARNDDELIDAIILMIEALVGDELNAVLMYELHAQALRDDTFRQLAHEWSRRSKAAVERYCSPQTAAMIEIIWDGAILSWLGIQETRVSEEHLRTVIRSVISSDDSRRYPAG